MMKHRLSTKRSIRRKLLLTMIGLIVVLLTLATFMQIVAQKKILETELDKRIALMKEKLIDRGETLVVNLTGQVRSGMATVNLSLLPEILQKAITEDKDLQYAILMDNKRTAFIHTQRPQLEQDTLNAGEDLFAAKQTRRTIHKYDINGQSYIEFIEPIQISMEPWGVLRLGFSLAQLNQEILASRTEISAQTREMIVRSLLIALIFIIVGAAIVALGSNKLSRPLMELTRVANALAKGNFAAAKKIKPSSTYEIDVLANALLEMSKNLKSSYQDLADYNRTLEQKVEQRTGQLVVARDEAVSANNSKSEFLSIVSHEIRTPMNAILGMSNLLLKTALSYKQHDYLDKIQASAKTLLSIINDILDFSKIEAGKLEFEHINFNLAKVLSNLSSVVAFDAKAKGLTVHFNVARDVPLALKGDPIRLGQVLLNLVNNAIKFTDCGEIIVTIECIADHSHDHQQSKHVMLRFVVEDTGIGLSNEQISRVFQPFSQADISTTRKYGGTGMGLAICKRLIDIMGGTISVTSQINKGSVFLFTALFETGDEIQPQQFLIPDSLVNLKVLIIDDDVTSREILSAYLESMNFAVTAVNSISAGVEQLENPLFRDKQLLVLLGCNKSQAAGFAFALNIKQNHRSANPLKIIMIMPFDIEEDLQIDRTGVDKILIKPVNASMLFDAVMELFSEKLQKIARTIEIEENNALALKNICNAHLLLVEDQLINQLVANEFLTHAGFHITIADNGKKALQLLQDNQFDAVLMDLQMPEMDGYETTQRIRADAKYAHLPIIAMTAHVMTGEREKCLLIGMNDYIAKPIDEEKLHSTLIKWIKPTEVAALRNGKLPHGPKAGDSKRNYPGLDIRQGLKNVSGNKALWIKLLLEFSQSFADSASGIKKHLDNQETAAAKQIIHALKGVADILALVEIQACLITLTHAVTHQHEAIPKAVAELESALHQVLDSIKHVPGIDVPEEKKPVHFSPTDCEKLPPLLQKIALRVRSNSIDTELDLNELKRYSGHCGESREIGDFSAAVKRYDFEKARSLLNSLAKRFNVKLENIPPELLPPDDRQKILIVDDVPVNIRFLIETFAQDYYIAVTIRSEETLAIAASDHPPDVILLDVEMPGKDGYQVCRQLKKNARTRNIPVIFITGRDKIHDETAGLELGAVDYITKPYSASVVNARIEAHLKLKKQNDLLEKLVCQDALTQIPNRRKFDELMEIEWHRAQRSQSQITIIFIDVDFFKDFNDYFGHSKGDNCLIKIAQALNSTLKRNTDVVARYGGEEFIAILPDTDIQAGMIKAEEMRENVYALNIPHQESNTIGRVTISLGVACMIPKSDKSPDSLIKMADDALYIAKGDGRNRVSQSPMKTPEY